MRRFLRRNKGSASEEAWVFVNYRRRHLASVQVVANVLGNAFGDDHVFFDVEDIHGGMRWETVLRSEVTASDVLIPVITEDWLDDIEARAGQPDFVVHEISLALDHDVTLVPLLMPGASMPSKRALPSEIANLVRFQALEFDPDRASAGAELVDAVGTVAGNLGRAHRATRMRRVRIAGALARHFEESGKGELIRTCVSGGDPEQPCLVVTDGGLAFVDPDPDVATRTVAWEEVFAIHRDRDDLWIMGLHDQQQFKRLQSDEIDEVLTISRGLYEGAPIDKAPQNLDWRARRIARARRDLDIGDESMATGGTQQGDAVLVVGENSIRIVRRRKQQSGVAEVALGDIAAVCVHKGTLWIVSVDGEHRLDNIPEQEIESVIEALRAGVPKLVRFDKPPDREIRESLIVLDPNGLAARSGVDLAWVREMRPTAEESIVLTTAKLWVMEQDLAADPDIDDRERKRAAIGSFMSALVAACVAEAAENLQAADSLKELHKAITKDEGWAGSFHATLGSLDPEDARRVMLDPELFEALMSWMSRRERALILLVELASFYPWTKGLKFEPGTRESACRQIAEALGAEVDGEVFDHVDKELRSRAKRLANAPGLERWVKIGAAVAGGVAIGVVSGGVAAPVIGSMIGSSMGLSGAAATSAGLALLGGGSIAAGGAGMAGGAALVATLGGVTGAGVGLAGNRIYEVSREGLLTESVKLDLLSEMVMLEERREGGKVASIVGLLRAQVEDLRERIEQVDLLDEIDDLKDRLAILDRLGDALAEQLDRFIAKATAWIEEGDRAVEAMKATADPTLLITIEDAEGVLDGMERISRVIPAILTKEDGEQIGSVVVDVMRGSRIVDGEDALRHLGVRSEVAAALGGAAIDVIGHPLVWLSAASVLAASKVSIPALVDKGAALIPAGLAGEWLAESGINFSELAEAIVTLVERELREVAGGAAIDVAEGLRLAVG